MKKLVALSLSVVMIFSLVIVNTSATENSSNIPFIEEYALNFMRTSQNDDDIELLTVKEMYDLVNNINRLLCAVSKGRNAGRICPYKHVS